MDGRGCGDLGATTQLRPSIDQSVSRRTVPQQKRHADDRRCISAGHWFPWVRYPAELSMLSTCGERSHLAHQPEVNLSSILLLSAPPAGAAAPDQRIERTTESGDYQIRICRTIRPERERLYAAGSVAARGIGSAATSASRCPGPFLIALDRVKSQYDLYDDRDRLIARQ